ncbi:UNVERIFIED_ORG: DNA repair protein RecN (Recombination protein N) [Kosakonia oryzae]|uniref:DNA repair protein RecN n=1 Tax=Kosakonia radicincitans TaxID=283686 RepID=A0AAX2EQN4_9ENTR|nr:DNA repair protein RecN [Kosakonia radicincitans]MDP9566152.1 DNA repair protein RecN (Recombination protein N) [Kosakonia oryzae]SFE14680.1 DNA repair protein RecN (Recombination protein N) [Kosakonia radicincitans]SFR08505.1 DNA repair protein RecN (Recombination protein N) [Kosakonia radicincitans]SFT71792.1 DNA repair protein RecN (Recombination protein N) [Kosakonia radicincitans]SFX50956.1 DNA repair protein RecN (Recombination protein N) [Kosakonia radicincitans]
MLAQLTISNFAIVRELEIDFHSGMTAITGETGAGKSIAIDALGLCLGGRAEADMVRAGAPRADLCARFALKDTPAAQRWLEENQLEDGRECLLRRVISSDGRSRGFINGTAVPLSQLRELGQLLIQIHGQHAHQLLTKSEHQKSLLDGYAGEYALTQQMAEHYRAWHQSCRELAQHQQQSQERAARAELLHYQLKELNEFHPQPGEFEQIDEEYKRLANSGQLLSTSQHALNVLADGEEVNLQSQLYTARQLLTELAGMDSRLSGVLDMLEEAAIQISEASDELRHYCDRLDLDPNRLYELEQRISRQISLARKHHIAPEELPQFHQSLLDEQQLLDDQADSQETLALAVTQHHQLALSSAQALHTQRVKYAQELSELITESMHALSMPHGVFVIDVDFDDRSLTAEGADRIEFRVTTNPGQPLQPIAKVASGGELSRIALAIQVITARKMETPALIFDEVDVGISGPTAAVVGKLLRQLGESTQVMCVTHLPQVAGCGHHHFFVSKETDGAMTETHMQPLDKRARLQELARLLGGSEVTRNALANAKELLAA